MGNFLLDRRNYPKQHSIIKPYTPKITKYPYKSTVFAVYFLIGAGFRTPNGLKRE